MKTTTSSIEPLEARIAPASLNAAGTILTYTDIDGDLVKLTVTGGAHLTTDDFTFSPVGGDDITTRQRLTLVDLTGQTGAGFTLSATPQRSGGVLRGNSHANIAHIDATNTDVGTINVDGDVLQLEAGTGNLKTLGLKSFTALSLGLATNAGSAITVKNAGTFTVKTDVGNETLTFTGGVKALSIGGDLRDTSDSATTLKITGDVGSLKIGGSVVAAYNFQSSISISSGSQVGTFSIGGSIIGGLQDITTGSYQIVAGDVKTFTLGGDLRGRDGRGGGTLYLDSAGSVKIGGSISGGTDASFNGLLNIVGNAQSITIGGSLIAGNATTGTVDYNGTISIGGNLGSFKLGHDFIGGRQVGGSLSAFSSAFGVSGTVGTLAIGGSVIGYSSHPVYLTAGGGSTAESLAAIKTFTVKGSLTFARLLAGYGLAYDMKNLEAGIGSITVGGNVVGSHIYAGSIPSTDAIPGTSDDIRSPGSRATIGSVKIGGDFRGVTSDSRFYYLYAPVINHLTVGKASFTHADLMAHVSFTAIGTAVAISVV